jgi:predicted nuclease of restriction endonuclease-like (RecB) superfamily
MVRPLTSTTLKQNATDWLKVFRFQESGTVIQVQDDCEFYIPLVFKANRNRNLKLFYIKLNDHDLLQTLGRIVRLSASSRVGVFISHISSLLTPKKTYIWYELEEIIRKNPNFSVLIFSETDLTGIKFKHLVNHCSGLFANVIYYPLYGQADTLQFINYRLAGWKLSLSPDLKEKIAKVCGGQLWFASQLLRIYRDRPNITFNEATTDQVLKEKVGVFWSKFSKKEQLIIKNYFYKRLSDQDKQSHEFIFLKKIHVLGLPLLKLVIESGENNQSLVIKRGELYLKDRPVSADLTRAEELALRFLVKTRRAGRFG